MLPFYKAIAFEKYALAGGSSQPCIVSVEDEFGNILEDAYVVKLFKTNSLNHTCKEVYAAFLAQHFDLKTPEPVLIEVNHTLIQELKKHEKYKNWHITAGVFFASKHLHGVKSITDGLSLQRYDKWEMGNIFAFDVLIMNTDRQVGKPNVIIKNNDIYVIDHELSMSVSHTFDEYVNQNHWDYFIKDKRGGHLFRNALNQLGQKEKITFDEFVEHLRTLAPETLYKYAEQLADYNYEALDIRKIVSYLASVKKKEAQFLALLDKLIY